MNNLREETMERKKLPNLESVRETLEHFCEVNSICWQSHQRQITVVLEIIDRR
jgi:hypothetical protein